MCLTQIILILKEEITVSGKYPAWPLALSMSDRYDSSMSDSYDSSMSDRYDWGEKCTINNKR